jgi:phospholipid/cholesterol/gamma-HCH transport system substrate-binding protein
VPDGGRLADVKVGAFVLAALAILIAGSLWIAGSTLFGPPRISYKVLMQDSGGLQAGDRVRLAGVSVGRIQRVNLQPGTEWPVTLSVAVKRGLELKTDASARIATSGLLGASHLELIPGTPDADALPVGGEIRGSTVKGLEDTLAQLSELSEKAVMLLDQTSSILETVSGEIGPILGNLESLLSEDNVEDVRNILAELRSITEQTGPRVASLMERLDSISQQLEGGLEGVPDLAAKLDALVADVHAAFGPDGQRLARVLESAETSLGSAGDALAVLGGNRGEIEATLRDLRDTVANLKVFSQQVKEHPYSMVRIKPEPERKPGDGVKKGSE